MVEGREKSVAILAGQFGEVPLSPQERRPVQSTVIAGEAEAAPGSIRAPAEIELLAPLTC
jgi:hypothetical protein